MIRTLHSARRSLRAALAAEACDTRAVVRIRYVDRHGTVSVRDISPHTLRATNTGHITVRAFDHRDGEDTTFRTDRITIA
jgi:predicted DNA-binding transcriptional regulator YafY